MKWTDEKIEKLITLVERGYRPVELAEILGFTKKAISIKMNKMGLRVVFTSNKLCKNCGNSFESYIKEDRLFCSKSCSASFNNSNRTHSEFTKQKISEKLKNVPRKIKSKEQIHRKCKICGEIKVSKKYKSICESCKTDYYQFYRHECNFKFSVFNYPNEFDLDLIQTHGWYSPSNKRNNLKGVSKDHMFSVMDGYKNKVSASIISHPANCELLLYSENSKKKDNSSITLHELMVRIERWEKKYEKKLV